MVTTATKRKIRPREDYVVLRPVEEEKTEGGLVLPEVSQEEGELRVCEVIEAGPGRMNEDGVRLPMDVKVGDLIYTVTSHEPAVVRLNGEKLMLLRSRHIIGICEIE